MLKKKEYYLKSEPFDGTQEIKRPTSNDPQRGHIWHRFHSRKWQVFLCVSHGPRSSLAFAYLRSCSFETCLEPTNGLSQVQVVISFPKTFLKCQTVSWASVPVQLWFPSSWLQAQCVVPSPLSRLWCVPLKDTYWYHVYTQSCGSGQSNTWSCKRGAHKQSPSQSGWVWEMLWPTALTSPPRGVKCRLWAMHKVRGADFSQNSSWPHVVPV